MYLHYIVLFNKMKHEYLWTFFCIFCNELISAATNYIIQIHMYVRTYVHTFCDSDIWNINHKNLNLSNLRGLQCHSGTQLFPQSKLKYNKNALSSLDDLLISQKKE